MFWFVFIVMMAFMYSIFTMCKTSIIINKYRLRNVKVMVMFFVSMVCTQVACEHQVDAQQKHRYDFFCNHALYLFYDNLCTIHHIDATLRLCYSATHKVIKYGICCLVESNNFDACQCAIVNSNFLVKFD